MSVRERIKMTPAEELALLGEELTVIVTTLGPRGWPHSMPMWFVVRDGEVWIWTYGASQKVRNLERDPRATLQLETGDTYDQLRGVMLHATTELHRDTGEVAALGAEILARYGGASVSAEVNEAILAQARKRVGLQFVVERVASWDHRKLAGTY